MKKQHAITAAVTLALSFALVGVVHTATKNATVEQRLQKLEDLEEIRTLLIHYGRELDKRDFNAYGKLFAKDGTWKGGMGGATGPEAIGKMVEAGFGRMKPEQYVDSNHVMTSMDVNIDGDTATAWSRWLWVVKYPDGKPRVERAGHYEDTLVRENGQWKFKARRAFTEINP